MSAHSHVQESLSFVESRSGVGTLGERVAVLARRLWPYKTAPNLAARTGRSIRAAELLLSGTNGLSGEALAALLQSDIGFQVLQEVMGEARPSWWADVWRARRIAELERSHEAQARLIEELRAIG